MMLKQHRYQTNYSSNYLIKQFMELSELFQNYLFICKILIDSNIRVLLSKTTNFVSD